MSLQLLARHGFQFLAFRVHATEAASATTVSPLSKGRSYQGQEAIDVHIDYVWFGGFFKQTYLYVQLDI